MATIISTSLHFWWFLWNAIYCCRLKNYEIFVRTLQRTDSWVLEKLAKKWLKWNLRKTKKKTYWKDSQNSQLCSNLQKREWNYDEKSQRLFMQLPMLSFSIDCFSVFSAREKLFTGLKRSFSTQDLSLTIDILYDFMENDRQLLIPPTKRRVNSKRMLLSGRSNSSIIALLLCLGRNNTQKIKETS